MALIAFESAQGLLKKAKNVKLLKNILNFFQFPQFLSY